MAHDDSVPMRARKVALLVLSLPDDVCEQVDAKARETLSWLEAAKWLREWLRDEGREDVEGVVAVQAVRTIASSLTQFAIYHGIVRKRELEARAYALGFHTNTVWNTAYPDLLVLVEKAEGERS